jgi:hypothetical protein
LIAYEFVIKPILVRVCGESVFGLNYNNSLSLWNFDEYFLKCRVRTSAPIRTSAPRKRREKRPAPATPSAIGMIFAAVLLRSAMTSLSARRRRSAASRCRLALSGSQTVSYGTRRGRWKMHRADTIVLPLGVQRARRRAAAGHLVARRLHRRRRRARICLAWVFGSLRIRAMAKTNLPRPYSRGFFFGRRRRRAMTMSRRGVSTLRFFPTPSTQNFSPRHRWGLFSCPPQ